MELSPGIDVNKILEKIKELYKSEKITTIDGVKIDFRDSWIHLRKSNTEPIVRIYSEAGSTHEAEKIAGEMMANISELATKSDLKN